MPDHPPVLTIQLPALLAWQQHHGGGCIHPALSKFRNPLGAGAHEDMDVPDCATASPATTSRKNDVAARTAAHASVSNRCIPRHRGGSSVSPARWPTARRAVAAPGAGAATARHQATTP